MLRDKKNPFQKTLALISCYLIGLLLLLELRKWYSFPGSDSLDEWLPYVEIALAFLVLLQIKFRGNLWYIFLLLGIAVIYITSAIQSPKALEKTDILLKKGVLVYALCPAVALLLKGKDLKRFLQCFIMVWTIISTVISLLGLYAVMNGLVITSYNGKYIIGLGPDHELRLWTSHYNTTATALAVSGILALIGTAMATNKTGKILHSLPLIPYFVCLALTSGRTGELGFLIAIGLTVTFLLQKSMALHFPKKRIQILLSLFLVLVISATGLIAFNMTQHGVNNWIQTKGGILIHSAGAETVSVTENTVNTTNVRGFFTDNFLTNRDIIWREAIHVLIEHPIYLITGTSIPLLMKTIKSLNPNFPSIVSHLHNIYLQILASTGIFGFILCLIFIFYVIRAAWRLFFDSDRPLWERLTVIVPVFMFVMQLVESFCLNNRTDIVGVMTMFAGVAIVFAKKPGTKESLNS